MKRFKFFNKMDGVIDDLNLAFDQFDAGLKEFMNAQYGKGFFQTSINTNFRGFDVILPVTTQGASGVDFIDILVSSPSQIIAGLDQDGNIIRISQNSSYQNSDVSLSSGNQDIPINLSASLQPYDRYIWIAYRETSDPLQTRVDYDGGLYGGPPPFTNPPFVGPVKNNGYEIIVSDLDPVSYTHPTGLYIGKVTVAGGIQTFTSAGTGAYHGQLRCGVADSNVKITPRAADKTASYSNSDTLIPDKQLTAKDHINAFGTGTVTPENPHGIHPDDMDQIAESNIADHSVTNSKLSAIGDGVTNTASVDYNNIFNYSIINSKLSRGTDPGGYSVDTNNLAPSSVTNEKLAADVKVPVGAVVMWAGSVLNIPTGWHLCDGSYIPATPDLISAIGSIWGVLGANIKLPDLRGAFIRGASNAGGPTKDPDMALRTPNGNGLTNDSGSLQIDDIKNHIHLLDIGQSKIGNFSWAAAGARTNDADATDNFYSKTDGGSPGTETRPVNYYLAYIIRII